MNTRDVSNNVRFSHKNSIIEAIVRRGATSVFFVCVLLSIDVFSATLTVNKSLDSNDGICDSDCSLREAIAAANNGDLIIFNEQSFVGSTIVTITLGELVIDKKITIYGSSQNHIEIKASSSSISPSRVYYVPATGELTLINATVSGGTAPLDYGGGIFSLGIVTLINTTVRNNSAGEGGGIENRGTLSVTNSTINNNVANHPQSSFAWGGGIANGGVMTLVNTTISNNQAGRGGGIHTASSSTSTLRNVTLANNTAGGITRLSGTINIGSTVIANNTLGDIEGTVISEGFNLIKNLTSTQIIGNTTGNILGVDPLFDANGLQDNGGATRTIALQQNSPAVDKGNGTIAGIATDQRGFARPVDNPSIPNAPGGDASDMGAFEIQGGPVISLNNVSASEANSGTSNLVFDVVLSATHNQTVSVEFATTNGSAISPGDYQTTSGLVSFAPGETSKQVSVSINGDFLIEEDETFAVNLSNASNGTVSASNGHGIGTILNDDVAGSFHFSSASYNVGENGGTATITVTRDGGIGSGASIAYATQNGTATAGQDYTAASGTLDFGANEISKSFSVDILFNPSPEPSETVNLGIFNPTLGGTIGTPGAAVLTINDYSPAGLASFDYDGDGKTDPSIFRPLVGQWWYLRSSDFGNRAFNFGTATDKLVPADYTGDGKTDIAFWRESTGEWFVLRSEDSSFYSVPFGSAGDIPAPGDFDGDGKADTAVYRPSQGTWYIQNSSGGTTIQGFGIPEDKPTVADFDGDGKDDIAIFRPSNSQWWQFRSQDGVIAYQFGTAGDKTVPGDYTGDGKADIAFFRPSNGNWFVLKSEDSSYYSVPFGISTDLPTPGDYDGDGKADTAVFRPSDSNWYVQGSTSGFFQVGFGQTGDIPVPNAYVRP